MWSAGRQINCRTLPGAGGRSVLNARVLTSLPGLRTSWFTHFAAHNSRTNAPPPYHIRGKRMSESLNPASVCTISIGSARLLEWLSSGARAMFCTRFLEDHLGDDDALTLAAEALSEGRPRRKFAATDSAPGIPSPGKPLTCGAAELFALAVASLGGSGCGAVRFATRWRVRARSAGIHPPRGCGFRSHRAPQFGPC